MDDISITPESLDDTLCKISKEGESDAIVLERRTSLLKRFESFKNQNDADELYSDEETDQIAIDFLKAKIRASQKEFNRKSFIDHTFANLNKSLALIAENYASDNSFTSTFDNSETQSDDEKDENASDLIEVETSGSLDTTLAVINKKQFNFKAMNGKQILKLFSKLSKELNIIEETFPHLILSNTEKNLNQCLEKLENRLESLKTKSKESNNFLFSPSESFRQLIILYENISSKYHKISNLIQQLYCSHEKDENN